MLQPAQIARKAAGDERYDLWPLPKYSEMLFIK